MIIIAAATAGAAEGDKPPIVKSHTMDVLDVAWFSLAVMSDTALDRLA